MEMWAGFRSWGCWTEGLRPSRAGWGFPQFLTTQTSSRVAPITALGAGERETTPSI